MIFNRYQTSGKSHLSLMIMSSKNKLNIYRIRALGSAALNMASVAAGGTDAYYEFGLHAWDMAAGDLIIREAGGAVMDTEGNLSSTHISYYKN